MPTDNAFCAVKTKNSKSTTGTICGSKTKNSLSHLRTETGQISEISHLLVYGIPNHG
jgi:hypothetical protein